MVSLRTLNVGFPTTLIVLYTRGGGGGGGLPPSYKLMGIYRWMGSHFHDWIDYNGVAFSFHRVTKLGSLILGIFG